MNRRVCGLEPFLISTTLTQILNRSAHTDLMQGYGKILADVNPVWSNLGSRAQTLSRGWRMDLGSQRVWWTVNSLLGS